MSVNQTFMFTEIQLVPMQTIDMPTTPEFFENSDTIFQALVESSSPEAIPSPETLFGPQDVSSDDDDDEMDESDYLMERNKNTILEITKLHRESISDIVKHNKLLRSEVALKDKQVKNFKSRLEALKSENATILQRSDTLNRNVKSFVECPTCFENFDDKERIPHRCGNCGYTWCKECVDRQKCVDFGNDISFKCAQCSTYVCPVPLKNHSKTKKKVLGNVMGTIEKIGLKEALKTMKERGWIPGSRTEPKKIKKTSKMKRVRETMPKTLRVRNIKKPYGRSKKFRFMTYECHHHGCNYGKRQAVRKESTMIGHIFTVHSKIRFAE